MPKKQTNKKNSKKSQKKQGINGAKVGLAIVLVALLTFGGLSLARYLTDENRKVDDRSDKNTAELFEDDEKKSDEEINNDSYDRKDEAEKDADSKIENQTNDNGKTIANVSISSAGVLNDKVLASGMVSNIIEEGGSCTYAFTNGETTFTETTTGIANAKNTVCSSVTLDKNELSFNGKDQVVSVKSVVLDGTTLSAGDYKLAGEFSGFEVRKYTLQVEGVGNYTGSVPVEWNIAQAPTGTVTTTPTGSVTPKPTETTKPATTTPTVTANPTATTKPSPIPFTPRPQRAPVTTVSPTPTATPSPKAGAKDEDSKSGTGSGSGSAGGTSPGKATAGGSVATGDETNAEIWLIMMAACVVVLITLREKRTGSSHEE